MKPLFLVSVLAIALTACQLRDGKYVVYQSIPGSSSDLDGKLIAKYSNREYQLKFSDKYAKLDSRGFSIILAKINVIPNVDEYDYSDIEGYDSVSVTYKLLVDGKDTKLVVGASRKGHQPFLWGNEANAVFYLSK